MNQVASGTQTGMASLNRKQKSSGELANQNMRQLPTPENWREQWSLGKERASPWVATRLLRLEHLAWLQLAGAEATAHRWEVSTTEEMGNKTQRGREIRRV